MNEVESHDLRRLRSNLAVRVLPYGITLDAETSEPNPAARLPSEGQRILLFLGPIHPVEGLVPLIRAIGELGHDFRGWKLLIAGPEPGEWRQKMEAAVERKGAGDRVTFVADPDPAAQRDLLSRASLLAALGLRVHCPVSAMRGIVCGIPVIATDSGLSSSLLENVHACMPTRGGIRDTLRPLITCSDEERARVRALTRQSCIHRLNWEVVVNDFVQLYESAVGP